MSSRKEIEDQIAALQAEADQMGDGDDEYEVEIWNEKGEGARVPHSQGKNWLAAKFPELFPSDPADNADTDGQSSTNAGKSKPAGKVAPGSTGTVRTGTATKYFGKRPAGK
jgi:hypothetical protein